jgi:hypothetical protein
MVPRALGKGREVDLVVAGAGGLTAVETKSAQTINEDFFRGLEAFAGLVERGHHAPSLRRVLVYGGAARQQRSRATVLPWSSIHHCDWITPISPRA